MTTPEHHDTAYGPYTPLIYERLAAIMADVPAIPKGQQNKQQGYSFRGIDDLYDALHGLFVKHQVVILPNVMDADYVDRDRGSKLAVDARLVVEYRFVTTDGSSTSIVVQGESRDYADKATNQAMSAALKYGLLQMFLVPLAGTVDPDHETPEIEPAPDPVIVAKNRLVDILGTKTEAAAFWRTHQSMTPQEIVELALEQTETAGQQLPIEEER